MEQQRPAGRACPACGSDDSAFRSRKQVEVDPRKGEPARVEAKYGWKE